MSIGTLALAILLLLVFAGPPCLVIFWQIRRLEETKSILNNLLNKVDRLK